MPWTYTDVSQPWDIASYLLTKRYNVPLENGRKYSRNDCLYISRFNLISLVTTENYLKVWEENSSLLSALDFIYETYGEIGVLHIITESVCMWIKEKGTYTDACKLALKQEIPLMPKYNEMVVCNVATDYFSDCAHLHSQGNF